MTKKILFIDDSRDVSEVIELMFIDAGHEIVLFESALSALETIKDYSVTLRSLLVTMICQK